MFEREEGEKKKRKHCAAVSSHKVFTVSVFFLPAHLFSLLEDIRLLCHDTTERHECTHAEYLWCLRTAVLIGHSCLAPKQSLCAVERPTTFWKYSVQSEVADVCCAYGVFKPTAFGDSSLILECKYFHYLFCVFFWFHAHSLTIHFKILQRYSHKGSQAFSRNFHESAGRESSGKMSAAICLRSDICNLTYCTAPPEKLFSFIKCSRRL